MGNYFTDFVYLGLPFIYCHILNIDFYLHKFSNRHTDILKYITNLFLDSISRKKKEINAINFIIRKICKYLYSVCSNEGKRALL